MSTEPPVPAQMPPPFSPVRPRLSVSAEMVASASFRKMRERGSASIVSRPEPGSLIVRSSEMTSSPEISEIVRPLSETSDSTTSGPRGAFGVEDRLSQRPGACVVGGGDGECREQRARFGRFEKTSGEGVYSSHRTSPRLPRGANYPAERAKHFRPARPGRATTHASRAWAGSRRPDRAGARRGPPGSAGPHARPDYAPDRSGCRASRPGLSTPRPSR